MSGPDPYAPPRANNLDAWRANGGCPQCGAFSVSQPSFTWWGGAVGPKLFKHAVCGACGFGFNAETGESNKGKITAYLAVSAFVGIIIMLLLWGR